MPPAFPEETFRHRFQAEPTHFAIAPGRINLIGEHTDYNDGFVFPVAIDKQLKVAARVVEGPTRLFSEEVGAAQEFDVHDLAHGTVEGWAAYAAGVAWALKQKGFEDLPNVEAIVESDVPIGSGVSSSAALELAFGVLWNQLAGLALDNKELARIGQYAENNFVGVACGIMDQMASAMGRDGHALFLDTRTLDIHYAKLPEGVKIVLCDTQTPRALTDSAYNERRRQCEEAAHIIGAQTLRDVETSQVEEHRDALGDVVYRRAKHVTTENERCIAFRTALEVGDQAALGPLMRASHESLRDDYEVSSKELDAMAEAAWSAPGCIGARMTGAGFGGACVALVESLQLDAFTAHVRSSYKSATSLEGNLLPCLAVDGARTF